MLPIGPSRANCHNGYRMSDVSAALKSNSAEEVRLRNYKAAQKQRNDIELREMEQTHEDEVKRMAESHMFQVEEMKRAYEVQLSQQAEQYDEALQKARESGE